MTNSATTEVQTARKTINGHDISIEIHPVSVDRPTYVVTCGCGQDGPWEAYYAGAAEIAVRQHTETPFVLETDAHHETYVEYEGPTYYWWCASLDCEEEPEHYATGAEARDAAAAHEARMAGK